VPFLAKSAVVRQCVEASVCKVLSAFMPMTIKPSQAFSAFWASVFFRLYLQILINAMIFYIVQIRNYIGMIANTVDKRPLTEFYQPFAG